MKAEDGQFRVETAAVFLAASGSARSRSAVEGGEAQNESTE
jgi:hypothetical protein